MAPRGTNTPEHSEPGLVQLAAEWTQKGLSRRDFVRLTGAGISAATLTALLAACGGAETPTTAPVASTVPSTAPSTAASVAPTAATGGAASAASAAPSASGGGVATRTATGAGTPAAGGASGQPSGGKYSTLEPVGKKGGTFVETVVADAKTNNSMLSTDVPSNDRISIQFNPLLLPNPDTGLPYPVLATEVPSRENGGISQDGLTYTLKLRKDVKWHDGQPFTSKDVVFTYQTLAKKELGSPRTAEITDRVDSVTAADDYTVAFKLKKVVAPFLVSNVASTNYSIVPEHILGSVPVDQIKQHPFSTGDAKASVGTGPFKFKEWTKDDHATFVKSPNYFLGEPALDQYVFKVVKDQDVVVANLKTGEGDFGAISPGVVEDVSKVASLNVVKYDTYGFTFYSHQLDASKTTLFQQKEVRQALAYALDRDAMVQAIYNGFAVIGQGTMPTLSFAYAPDQLTTKYPYDIKKAEQLLDAAGWVKGSDGIRAKEGKKLQFTLWTGNINKVFGQLITVMQQQWKAIGVDATPKIEEWNAFLSRITETHDFEMFLVGFSWGIDPDQTTMWASQSYNGGFNMGKYANTQVDQLLAQGLTELDIAKRKALYVQMQNILMDELPNVVLAFPQQLAAVNKRVKNFFPNAVHFRWNIQNVWLTDGK
jgi:peptide/nickel transport system substrate-binding protein